MCLLLIDFTSLGQVNSSHSYCYLLLSPATTIPLSCLCWEDLPRFCQADPGGTELPTLTVTARFFSDYLPSYSLPKAGRTAEHSQSSAFFWRVPPKIRLFKAGSVYSYFFLLKLRTALQSAAWVCSGDYATLPAHHDNSSLVSWLACFCACMIIIFLPLGETSRSKRFMSRTSNVFEVCPSLHDTSQEHISSLKSSQTCSWLHYG